MRRWMAAGALGALLASGAGASDPVSEAQTLAQRLRASDAIERVDECYPAGAKHIIVHIRNVHYASPAIVRAVRERGTPDEGQRVFDAAREIIEGIGEQQGRVAQILRVLTTEGYRALYTEGVVQEQLSDVTPDTIRAIIDERLGTLQMADMFKRDPSLDAYVQQRAMSTFSTGLYRNIGYEVLIAPPRDPPASYERAQRIAGAELAMYVEGQLELRPFERSDLYGKTDDDDLRIYDERENAFLEFAATQDDPVLPTLLGASHGFGGPVSCPGMPMDDQTSYRDNIAGWNAQHPENRIGLVQITPAGTTAFIPKHEHAYREVIFPIVQQIAARERLGKIPYSLKRPRRIVGDASGVVVE